MFRRTLPSGKIQYGEWYTDPLTDQRKRITITLNSTGSKKRDDGLAADALKARIREVYESAGRSDTLTLKALEDRYIEHQKSHYKAQSAESNRMHLNTIVKLLGPDTLADRLSAPFISSRLDADPTTYNERIRRFKAWIRWAYRMDLVDDIRYIDKLPPKKDDSVRIKDAHKYLEHDEIAALLRGMKVERWRLLTEFLILSGLRVGEAIALNDCDVADGLIHINKTYSVTIRQLSSTKTATSTRDVDIQPELADCIRRIRHFVRTSELQYGYRSELFLPAFRGGYIDYYAYCKYFRETSEQLLGRRLTPHALRHTHTAMLAEAGVPLETISRRLGHSDSKITREVYLHVTDIMRQRDRERIRQVKIL